MGKIAEKETEKWIRELGTAWTKKLGQPPVFPRSTTCVGSRAVRATGTSPRPCWEGDPPRPTLFPRAIRRGFGVSSCGTHAIRHDAGLGGSPDAERISEAPDLTFSTVWARLTHNSAPLGILVVPVFFQLSHESRVCPCDRVPLPSHLLKYLTRNRNHDNDQHRHPGNQHRPQPRL